jgi:DNA-binding MarR family transcriptional regulator
VKLFYCRNHNTYLNRFSKKLDNSTSFILEVRKTTEAYVEEVELPDSCKKVFTVIVEEGPLSSKEIVTRVSCSTRSVRYALKRLLDNEYVERHPCLQDMRQTLYTANINHLKGEMTAFRRIQ